MISVIIPVFNHPEKLRKSLSSLSRQTYKDFEVILIDDGSDVEVKDVFHEFKLLISKLRYFKIAHSGANKARQTGAKLASGEYMIFWDSDVIGRSDMLEKMLSALREHPEASYAYSSYHFGLKGFKIWPFDPERLRRMPYIHTTSLIRYKHFPGWDLKINRLQDWDLWLTMLEKGYQGIYIPEYLFKIITGGTMSAWLPMNKRVSQLLYKKPFINLLPSRVKTNYNKYKEAVKIIKQKHKLS